MKSFSPIIAVFFFKKDEGNDKSKQYFPIPNIQIYCKMATSESSKSPQNIKVERGAKIKSTYQDGLSLYINKFCFVHFK